MPPLTLCLQDMRLMLLAAQGICETRPKPATRKDVLSAIQRMGALQIDTILIVARSPYLVLWSRLGSYDPATLDSLLEDKSIFEYWSHEACFLPMEDYPLYRHRMTLREGLGWKYPAAWAKKNAHTLTDILETIRARGEVRSSDFKRTDGKASGWWEWKPEKRALEALFSAGEIMVTRRMNFHRIYDLRDRVVPDPLARKHVTEEEAIRNLLLKSVKALGAPLEAWVPDYFRIKRAVAAPILRRLVAEGALIQADVRDGKPGDIALVHPDNLLLLQDIQAGKVRATRTTLLSPFDPIVWDRTRAKYLFGFDYKIECYTPAEKRQYGYFTLPILHRDKLVGRLDPKAHRADGVFEIKHLHLEPEVKLTDVLASSIARAVRDCASWHGTPTVRIGATTPARFASILHAKLSSPTRSKTGVSLL